MIKEELKMMLNGIHSIKRLRARLTLAASVLVLISVIPAAFAAPATSTGKQAVIEIKGMSCPFCAYGAKKHLLTLPGAKKVDMTLGKDQAIVDFAPDSKVTDDQIRKAVRDAGFTPGKIEWRNAGQTEQSGSPGASVQGTTTSRFAIEGIRCTYCAANISTSLEKQSAVKSVQVDWEKKIASVTYDPQKTSPKEIIQTIEKAGNFRAREVGSATAEVRKQ